jgi:hypothetical protein
VGDPAPGAYVIPAALELVAPVGQPGVAGICGAEDNMELVVHTVPGVHERNRIGHSETIPRWGVGARAALGLLSFIALLIPVVLLSVALLTPPGHDIDTTLLGGAFGMFIFHGLLVLFFVSFVVQNPRIEEERILWVLGLLVAAPLMLPIYWWKHIWKAPFVAGGRRDHEVPDRVAGDRG